MLEVFGFAKENLSVPASAHSGSEREQRSESEPSWVKFPSSDNRTESASHFRGLRFFLSSTANILGLSFPETQDRSNISNNFHGFGYSFDHTLFRVEGCSVPGAFHASVAGVFLYDRVIPEGRRRACPTRALLLTPPAASMKSARTLLGPQRQATEAAFTAAVRRGLSRPHGRGRIEASARR